MPDIPFFGQNDAERIAANTRWGENVKHRSANFIASEVDIAQTQLVFARLMAKDDPEAGWWTAKEVIWKDDEWADAEPLRIFDDEENDLVRHKDFDDLQAGMIVQLEIIFNHETKLEEWVILREITNPEAFVLYGPEGQSAGSKVADWHMIKGGDILTNIGEAKLGPENLSVKDGYLGVQVTIVEKEEFTGSLGQGTGAINKSYVLDEVAYTNTKTAYWSADPDYRKIIINHPIATLSEVKGFARLEQHHAGDVHLEIFASGPSEQITIKCEKWIFCFKTGNNYTIKHVGPFASCPHSYEGHMGFDPNEFSCDELSGGTTLPDVIEWINANLIRIAQNLKWDERGHIYGKDNCDGSKIYCDEDEDDEDENDDEDYGNAQAFMESNELFAPALLAHVPAEFLVPFSVDPDSAIDSKYYLLKADGTPQLKPIAAGKFVQFIMTNSLNETMISRRTNNLMQGAFQDLALLVQPQATAGWTFDIIGDGYHFSTNKFRFNDVFTITGHIIAKGFPVTLEHGTLSVSDSIFANESLIRDIEDPLSEPLDIDVEYDLPALSGSYKCRICFEFAGNTFVDFSIDNGASFITELDIEIDNAGIADPPPIFFDLTSNANIEEGSLIVMRTCLLTKNTGFDASIEDYDANVKNSHNFNVQSDDDCIDDGSDKVSDGDDDCIESGDVPPANVCTPNFCGGDPSMAVSVVGASGTINWLGETWNLPVDSGVEKCVCPTTYMQQKASTGGVVGNSHAIHEWIFNTVSYQTLNLHRYFGGSPLNGWSNILRVVGGPNYDWEGQGGVVYSGLGLIIGQPAPTYSDYLITGAFFSSHTISGITYTWAKGTDWPV